MEGSIGKGESTLVKMRLGFEGKGVGRGQEGEVEEDANVFSAVGRRISMDVSILLGLLAAYLGPRCRGVEGRVRRGWGGRTWKEPGSAR